VHDIESNESLLVATRALVLSVPPRREKLYRIIEVKKPVAYVVLKIQGLDGFIFSFIQEGSFKYDR
jgi:hypothetical protein